MMGVCLYRELGYLKANIKIDEKNGGAKSAPV